MSMKFMYILIAAFAVIGLIAFFSFGHKKPNNVQSAKDYYSVSDEPVGVSFNISKKFTPIDKKELSSLNPNYLYGYRSLQDTNTACFISQTKLTKQGKITAEYLKNGTFNAVKKNYPSAKLNTWAPVRGKSAVFLDITYTNNNNKFSQPELVLVDFTKTTFAFCQTPQDLSQTYDSDFATFLSSVKLF